MPCRKKLVKISNCKSLTNLSSHPVNILEMFNVEVLKTVAAPFILTHKILFVDKMMIFTSMES